MPRAAGPTQMGLQISCREYPPLIFLEVIFGFGFGRKCLARLASGTSERNNRASRPPPGARKCRDDRSGMKELCVFSVLGLLDGVSGGAFGGFERFEACFWSGGGYTVLGEGLSTTFLAGLTDRSVVSGWPDWPSGWEWAIRCAK